MATLSENLQTLSTAKANIKAAIEGKGQSLTNVPFTEYASKINDIKTGNPDFMIKLLTRSRNLTEVTKEDLSGITMIGDYMFARCRQLVEVEIPNVGLISDYAFKDCVALTKITLPSSIFLISVGAFQNCSALTEIIIPSGVSEMMSYIFDGCTNLTSMSIPNVKKMGVYAFRNCTNLTSVELPETPPTLSSVNAFSGISATCTFYCPTAESLAAYQAATNWSSLASTYIFMVKE